MNTNNKRTKLVFENNIAVALRSDDNGKVLYRIELSDVLTIDDVRSLSDKEFRDIDINQYYDHLDEAETYHYKQLENQADGMLY